MDLAAKRSQRSEKKQSTAQQLRLYLGPEKEYPERFPVDLLSAYVLKNLALHHDNFDCAAYGRDVLPCVGVARQDALSR